MSVCFLCSYGMYFGCMRWRDKSFPAVCVRYAGRRHLKVPSWLGSDFGAQGEKRGRPLLPLATISMNGFFIQNIGIYFP